MNKEIEKMFDAATEAETLYLIDLPKIKVMLEHVTDITFNYTKYDKMFEQVADSTYIMTCADIAFDYTIDAIKRLETLSNYLYEECWKAKEEAEEHTEKTKLREVA